MDEFGVNTWGYWKLLWRLPFGRRWQPEDFIRTWSFEKKPFAPAHIWGRVVVPLGGSNELRDTMSRQRGDSHLKQESRGGDVP